MTGCAPLVVVTRDAEATQRLAAGVASVARVGDVVLLVGDLGAGKTAFAQGFGRALGISEPMTSPTFTLIRQYEVEAGEIRTLFHADVYRLDHLQEIADLGIGELVEDGGVALIEWGDMAAPLLGEECLTVELVPDEENDSRRTVTVRAAGESWVDRWDALGAAVRTEVVR